MYKIYTIIIIIHTNNNTTDPTRYESESISHSQLLSSSLHSSAPLQYDTLTSYQPSLTPSNVPTQPLSIAPSSEPGIVFTYTLNNNNNKKKVIRIESFLIILDGLNAANGPPIESYISNPLPTPSDTSPTPSNQSSTPFGLSAKPSEPGIVFTIV